MNVEVSLRGHRVLVPALHVDGRDVIVSGRWLRTARMHDEEWFVPSTQAERERIVDSLRSATLRADVFTYADVASAAPRPGGVRCDADNIAVIDTTDFEAWWSTLPQEARKNTRRAAKRGVVVAEMPFDDVLVAGIKALYDETPVRQGRRFWHYGKPLEAVRRDNSSYLDRSVFLGASFEGQLIGFIKWVHVGDVARIMQILCMNAHQDKRPIVALLARAAELCAQRGCRQLIYGKYTYGSKGDSSITEFKRRLGFTSVDVVRCHVPLTRRGSLALSMGLHEGVAAAIPAPVLRQLLDWRARWMTRHVTAA